MRPSSMRTGTATSSTRRGVRRSRWMSGSTPVSFAASSRRSRTTSHGSGIASMLRLRRRDSLGVVDEEVLDHVLQTVRRVALGQVDGDDVGVDVHTLHATVVEEATRQLVDRTNALRGITRGVAL